jgi:hypothetical protein
VAPGMLVEYGSAASQSKFSSPTERAEHRCSPFFFRPPATASTNGRERWLPPPRSCRHGPDCLESSDCLTIAQRHVRTPRRGHALGCSPFFACTKVRHASSTPLRPVFMRTCGGAKTERIPSRCGDTVHPKVTFLSFILSRPLKTFLSALLPSLPRAITLEKTKGKHLFLHRLSASSQHASAYSQRHQRRDGRLIAMTYPTPCALRKGTARPSRPRLTRGEYVASQKIKLLWEVASL